MQPILGPATIFRLPRGLNRFPVLGPCSFRSQHGQSSHQHQGHVCHCVGFERFTTTSWDIIRLAIEILPQQCPNSGAIALPLPKAKERKRGKSESQKLLRTHICELTRDELTRAPLGETKKKQYRIMMIFLCFPQGLKWRYTSNAPSSAP